ncbi:MAG: aldo/keto reductase [Acidiferrobacterales bacterium]|nr:aldo/keto reductase [Acidiferrobacterales bacterium]
MKTVQLPDGTHVPALGQGTWHMGMNRSSFNAEVEALRYGIEQGLTLIDTAEMYHDAELVVAEAIKGLKDQVFIVSKVLPGNASRSGTIAACENSLERLEIDCLDLYLLHWSGSYPIEDTLEAFNQLVKDGKIKRYGVSNLDPRELRRALDAPYGEHIATNQVLYNLHHRGIEWDLLPQCEERNIPVMAYSPLNQGHLAPEVLNQIGMRHNVSGYQVALAWVLQRQNVIAIPKAAKSKHIDRNLIAAEIELTYEEIKQLDIAFPPPKSAVPLEVI